MMRFAVGIGGHAILDLGGECRAQPFSSSAPTQVPVSQALELQSQNRCLQRVEAAVASDYLMVRTPASAMIPEQPQAVGDIVVIADDGTCVPERAKVLARIEAERSG